MTLDEAIARAANAADSMIDNELVALEIFFADRGGTAAEIEAELEHAKAELATWRRETLAELRRGLAHMDAPSVKVN